MFAKMNPQAIKNTEATPTDEIKEEINPNYVFTKDVKTNHQFEGETSVIGIKVVERWLN